MTHYHCTNCQTITHEDDLNVQPDRDDEPGGLYCCLQGGLIETHECEECHEQATLVEGYDYCAPCVEALTEAGEFE